ncbi:WRKY transcription factor 19 [Phytophthora cinnamomi]|uniref:WRKY transcription factor 19 n=1 Tax=Phytophthora cinnamomi TaxID=4785 RepID=UPI00355AA55C|nr:WRKY transcription factor 19 [Phytophthora cinnamomi]
MTSIALPPLTLFAASEHRGSLQASPATPVGTPKLSLAFILDDCETLLSPRSVASVQSSPSQRRSPKRKLSVTEKRAARQCCVEGCTNYTIDRGLCFRHGGGKSCSKPGCTASAKHRGLCWKHGGSTLCTVEGCTRGAKSRGLCWSHGGGTKCSVAGCQKTTISKGLSRAANGRRRRYLSPLV